MSQKLINRSPDLKRLRDEGYEVEVRYGYLLLHNIPYVNSGREIKYGTLISTLTLAGDMTSKPDNHVINFCGGYPCNNDGTIITAIQYTSADTDLGNGMVYNHSFSNKPANGYEDYYEKFTTYINIIMGQAFSIDNSVTAKTFKVIETSDESVFNYYDTNSSRAEISPVSRNLEYQKVGIIGLGGTGSYILDLVSKTPVAEIHLFDGDVFLQHNAFRAPGAPTIEKLREQQPKTDYLCDIYKNMHKHITSHPYRIEKTNINDLLGLNFVFICIDKCEIKREIVTLLVENKISFIDVGMGINLVDNSLIGTIRVTACTPEKSEHLSSRISFADGEDDEYSTNIQIADLNALNASFAVIKWKKLFKFYQDLAGDYNSVYSINDGELINEEK